MGEAFSTQRLGRMHDVLARHVDRGGAPGLVTALARGADVHVDAIGTKAVSGTDPMRPDTIFRIASMTKPITAVAAMILVEECVLRLDDPVDDVLPELADRNVLRTPTSALDDTVPAHRSITLRDLLTFTMGHGLFWTEGAPMVEALAERGFAPGPPRPEADHDPDEWMRRLGSLPLIHQPGERWMYHTGAEVLGVLIARATGGSLEAFLRERILEPLGMDDTGFAVPASKIERLATSYSTNPRTGALELYDEAHGGWSKPPPFPSGGGGLVSTAHDFVAFGQMLLNRGAYNGERILSRPTVELMTQNHLTPAQRGDEMIIPDSIGWGFGMSMVITRNEHASLGTYGWDGGLGTTWRNDPKEELIGVMLTQAAFMSPSPPEMLLDFWTCAYAALED